MGTGQSEIIQGKFGQKYDFWGNQESKQVWCTCFNLIVRNFVGGKWRFIHLVTKSVPDEQFCPTNSFQTIEFRLILVKNYYFYQHFYLKNFGYLPFSPDKSDLAPLEDVHLWAISMTTLTLYHHRTWVNWTYIRRLEMEWIKMIRTYCGNKSLLKLNDI